MSVFASSNAFNISAGLSSGPVALPFFIDLIAFSTSSFKMFSHCLLQNVA